MIHLEPVVMEGKGALVVHPINGFVGAVVYVIPEVCAAGAAQGT